jgi:hypothetical protein
MVMVELFLQIMIDLAEHCKAIRIHGTKVQINIIVK